MRQKREEMLGIRNKTGKQRGDGKPRGMESGKGRVEGKSFSRKGIYQKLWELSTL